MFVRYSYQTENGQTNIEVKIEDKAGDMIGTVAHVYPKDRSWSLHVTSFF